MRGDSIMQDEVQQIKGIVTEEIKRAGHQLMDVIFYSAAALGATLESKATGTFS
jgi:hypothetical protein